MKHAARFVIGLSAIALVFLQCAPPVWGAADSQDTEGTRSVTVTILDDTTGKPLAGAAVHVGGGCGSKGEDFEADDKGQVTFQVKKGDFGYVSVRGEKAGYVPMKSSWQASEKEVPPDAFELRLPTGTVVGGIIQNEAGEPIQGVKVFLLVPSDKKDPTKKVQTAIWDYEVKTDAEGRWRTDIMPAKLDDLWIRLAHSSYVSDKTYGATPKPSMEQLRDCTGVMVLKSGLKVSGVVVNEAGEPLSGTKVNQGSSRWGSHYPSTKTASKGRFRFRNCKPGQMVLTFQCDGYAPELLELDVQEDVADLKVTLSKPHTLRGRVLDTQDAPLDGVTVVADTWRGHRSLSMRTKTDAEGHFEFDSAPGDAVLYDILKQGYMSVRNTSLTAGDKEHTVTLPPELVISGQVVDSETQKPVPSFLVLRGIQWEGRNAPSWQRREPAAGKDGAYSMRLAYPYPGHLLKVEAEGYLPAVSRVFQSDEGTVSCDFELKKGTGLEGSVLTVEGTPAAKIDVFVCTPSRGAYLNNGRIRERGDVLSATTSEDGRFTIPPQTEPFMLFVASDLGWAEVQEATFTESKTIQLQPWARVEGQIFLGAAPGAMEKASLWYSRPWSANTPRFSSHYVVTADKEGRFAFDRVIPEKLQVGRYIAIGAQSWTSTHSISVKVEPGETATVTIGGAGRPIEGRIALPKKGGENVKWDLVHCRVSTKRQEPPLPDDWEAMPQEEKSAWYKEYQESPEYKKAQAAHRNFVALVDEKGAFRAEDIPAGEYKLTINAYAPAEAGRCGTGKAIGNGSHEFTVKAPAEGYTAKAQKLGKIDLTLFTTLKQGKAVPPLKTTTLDGKPLCLKDYRGKYVLLDFWATWCGPCKAKTPKLKEVYEAFGKRDDFVMVALSLDEKADTARAYVEKNNLDWVQGFLGKWSDTEVPANFGIRGIPALMLIDPEGNLVAEHLERGDIKGQVAKILGAS